MLIRWADARIVCVALDTSPSKCTKVLSTTPSTGDRASTPSSPFEFPSLMVTDALYYLRAHEKASRLRQPHHRQALGP